MSGVETQGTDELVTVLAEREAVPAQRVRRNDRGMISAEWAVGLIAAIAIAGVLLAVVTNGAVKEGLLKFILLVIDAFASNL